MHRKFRSIANYALALMFIVCGAGRALAQECPRASSTGPDIASQTRTLTGRLIFHDGIRQWFELKFDAPHCGQSSVELVETKKHPDALETFRGCRVATRGAIDFSPTGYYSLDTFQDVSRIQAVGPCSRQPPFPDYSLAKPDKRIRAYSVDMHILYGMGDHPIRFDVRSEGRDLRPWQVYARYELTGDFVLYGHCGDGFVVGKVFGTPEARPMHFDDPGTPNDMAAFDPESAAAKGNRDLRLGYTCVRELPQRQRKD